jgi:hypothetical protein
MYRALPADLANYLGPAAGAVVFVVLMSLVKEPARRSYNAIFVAGASGVYLSGGLGAWELLFPAVVGGGVAYLGLRSHRYIGVAWLLHAGWDLVHHLFGNPIWPFMATSSFGCLIFDTLIALWFLAGAPSVFALVRARFRSADTATLLLVWMCVALGGASALWAHVR